VAHAIKHVWQLPYPPPALWYFLTAIPIPHVNWQPSVVMAKWLVMVSEPYLSQIKFPFLLYAQVLAHCAHQGDLACITGTTVEPRSSLLQHHESHTYSQRSRCMVAGSLSPVALEVGVGEF
jgi:hypothetical protein